MKIHFYRRIGLMAVAIFVLLLSAPLYARADITTGLIGHWKMDEGVGTSTFDSSGNGRTGTLVNGPTWTSGKYAGGLSVDGMNDYVRIADNAVFTLNPATSYTWSAWVKNDDFTEWSTVWSQTVDTSNFFYFYAHTSSDPDGGPVTNGVSVYWWTNGGAQKLGAHSANNVLTAGQWSHVAVSYDAAQPQNNRFTIYVNGVDMTVRSDITSVGTLATINPTNTRIAANQPFGEYLNGTVDEVRYYNRVLSPAEIQSVMQSGGALDTTSPVISTINASSVTSNSAVIGWTTDEASDSQVEYGLTTSYGTSTTLNTALVTSHSQSLSGLTASTTYHYRVKSKDAVGNLSVSGDFVFATLAPPADPCGGSANPVVCENSKPGNPKSEWDVSGSGDSSIQGFATDISVNKGSTVAFKINTPASNYTIDIYRMGYYGGLGARKVATVLPSASLPQSQPSCLTNGTTGLIDCGNWAESASWTIPADAVSGIYFAKLVRIDTGGASHVVFIVRDDAGSSDILFQTSDTTWQAYNQYGGNSLYVGSPAGRAYKVSYNRPFTTRGTSAEDWVFNAEYPMVRWLERNGYDVSYFTGADSDRNGTRILQHKTFMSVGHDEYWSAGQRANVETARNAGVNLAFLSGNEMFWKTRWENSIDSSGTPYRTLVSYKETHADAKIDPLPNVWTGTWRDPRFSPPADGGRPENALTGTIFTANCCTYSMTAPGAYAPLRFWRNTAVANLGPSQTYTFPNGTLGYEWDHSPDNGFQPAGLVKLSATTVSGVETLLDYGSTYGTGSATHNLTMYRHPSGALVFGAGTVQWSWGLDSNHDRGSAAPDVTMQQATVNIFADMGVQPTTLQSGLIAATISTDSTAPMVAITSPANNSNFAVGAAITVQGTASDSGGQVAGVEVSVNGGATWHPASGLGAWSYTYTAASSATTTVISARAVDDSGNLALPQSVTITIGSVSPIVPTQGPGGPILIVASGSNPFSTYYKEILLAEGFNMYRMMDVSAVTATELASYDVVILGETPLSSAQTTMFTNWVNNGGNLIAMRPGASLAGLLGLTAQGTTLSDAYFKVNTASPPGTGITASPMQYHGIADRYTLNGATEAATLYSNITTSLNMPAVTNRAVGSAGGNAAAFAFDLAKSVIYTRQGNPAWSGEERDGEQPPIIRSDDLFFPDWVNFANIEIPQADEAQRLLGNMIQNMLAAKKPLPHFWYLPRGEKAAVIMTGDDHGNNGTTGRFNQYKNASIPGCSVADWDCIRSTSYMYASTPMSNAQAAAFVAEGFEIASHINTNCADWTPSTLQNFYNNDLAAFASEFPNIPASQTTRMHCITWSDYDTQPAVELAHGIRLDTNYYYWPPAWVQNRAGLFTGSGMPMRFADRNGSTIDVYQATTQFPDETNFTSPSAVINTLLDNAIGLKGYYGMFVVNAHTDGATAEPSYSVSNAVVNSAIARSVPIISAKQALDWMDGRNASSFSAVSWNAASSTLSFSIVQDARALGLTTLIPAVFGNTLSTLTRNGTSVSFTTVVVKGVSYAQFASDTGTYQAVYLVDTIPPTVSLTAPVSGATVSGPAVAVSATTSDNVSIAGVQFLLDGANLGAEDIASPYTTSWNTLSASNGDHTLAAVARDAAGNRATSTPITVTVNNAPDSTAPAISGISASSITVNSANITWLTDEVSDSQVEYGLTTSYGTFTTLTMALVTSHAQSLSGLTANTTYHYRVASRDVAGNLAVSGDFTFTTAVSAPQTIFTTQVPDGSATDGAGVNYELGTRFTSVVAGQITAVRFYKSPSESGTHTGRIWNAAGQQLASVVFTGETASGWQEQALAMPFSIAANTEYMVSVNTGNTYYVASDTGLQSQIASGDLRTIVGSNGRYGSPAAYPTNVWMSSNYFRDIVFSR